MLRQSSLRPDLEPMLRELAPVVASARRLMFTTDGAVPSFYAERGVIGGCLRIATALGLDPMRALQMATIDPATFLGLDEELGGIAPGRRATLNVLPAIGEWRPELVFVDGVDRRPRRRAGRGAARDSTGRPGRGWSRRRRRPSRRSPASSPSRATRARSSTGAPTATPAGCCRPRWSAATARGSRKGVIDNFLDVDGFATTATTSLELLVLGKDPAAMARAARRVSEMGGGFAFDGGWSAPLEIDGLIAAGGYDRALAIERELSDEMARAWLSVPRSAVLPAVRLRRLPAGAPVDAARRNGGQNADDRHESVTN